MAWDRGTRHRSLGQGQQQASLTQGRRRTAPTSFLECLESGAEGRGPPFSSLLLLPICEVGMAALSPRADTGQSPRHAAQNWKGRRGNQGTTTIIVDHSTLRNAFGSTSQEGAPFLGRDSGASQGVFWSLKAQQREQAPRKPSGAELFGARKSLITYICFMETSGGLGGEGSINSQLVDGEGPRRPHVPTELALSLWQDLLNDTSIRRQDQATEEESGFYAPRLCAVKENIPLKCELIGSCNWCLVLPLASWWGGGSGGLSTGQQKP